MTVHATYFGEDEAAAVGQAKSASHGYKEIIERIGLGFELANDLSETAANPGETIRTTQFTP